MEKIELAKIYTPNVDDFSALKDILGKFPIGLYPTIPEKYKEEKIPSQIIGWEFVKKNFSKANILEHTISKNLKWTFSKSEDEESFYKDVNEFVTESIKSWLPNNFIIFDCIIHSGIEDFIKNNINYDLKLFIYFHNDALYLKSGDNNIVINLKNLHFICNNVPLFITNFLNNFNCLCFSYSNLSSWVIFDELNSIESLENLCWVKYGQHINEDNFFNLNIPGFEIKKYIPFLMSLVKDFELDLKEKKYLERISLRDKIVQWLSNQYIAFREDFLYNDEELIYRGRLKFIKTSYNDKTQTGRIYSKKGFNFQNLSKESPDREKIVSRFSDGNICVIDYMAFESRISLYLSQDSFFIENYFDRDIHFELARVIYQEYNINEEQRSLAKNINHAILYGAGDKMLLKILNENKIYNSEVALLRIKNFLSPLIKTSKKLQEKFKKQGYLVNKWNTIIRPNKDYAIYNNYIQTAASEIMIDKIIEIKKLLDKYNSKFLFQIHDSIILDIHPNEMIIIDQIIALMQNYNGMFFNLDVKIGKNYKELYIYHF